MSLPDPARSRALIVGFHAYDTLDDLPAVTNNVLKLQEILTSSHSWGEDLRSGDPYVEGLRETYVAQEPLPRRLSYTSPSARTPSVLPSLPEWCTASVPRRSWSKRSSSPAAPRTCGSSSPHSMNANVNNEVLR